MFRALCNDMSVRSNGNYFHAEVGLLLVVWLPLVECNNRSSGSCSIVRKTLHAL